MCFGLGFKHTVDIPSPRHMIPKTNITYLRNEQKIEIKSLKPNIWLTTVADTNSMDPVIDIGHTAILTNDFNAQNLAIGDVVVYTNGYQDIMHRIIKIDIDGEGRRYTLKGDNNSRPDRYIVRDSHIKWLLLGVIY